MKSTAKASEAHIEQDADLHDEIIQCSSIEKRLTGSHSRRGNYFDINCTQSFFSHLKTEKLYLEKPKDVAHTSKLIAEYIQYYNKERFQKRLGDLSPAGYRERIALNVNSFFQCLLDGVTTSLALHFYGINIDPKIVNADPRTIVSRSL